MHDAICMHAAHCRSNFIKNIACLFFWKIVLINNNIKKFSAFTVLCDYVDEFRLLVNFVYFKHGRMILNLFKMYDCFQERHLVQSHHLCPRKLENINFFDCSEVTCLLMDCFKHFTIGSFTNFFNELVVSSDWLDFNFDHVRYVEHRIRSDVTLD